MSKLRAWRFLSVVMPVMMVLQLGILAVLPVPAFADSVVTFPDANLEAAIRVAISKPTGDIHASELAGLTSLTASGKGITNLAGLEYCRGLTHLALDFNQISNLSPLAGLISLTTLYLESNQISNLSPLAGLISLTTLSLRSNQISNLMPIAGLTNLDQLSLYNNQISNLTPLAGLTNLRGLGLDDNQISDLMPIGGLKSLNVLQLCNNQISSLAPLVGLTNLQHLYLDNNQINSLAPLTGLTSLTRLSLGTNKISDLTPLASLTNLTELNLDNNHQIINVVLLAGLTNLSRLEVGNTQISDLTPLTGLTNLSHLGAGNTQISDLTPLTGLTSLTTLNLMSNQIRNLSPLAGLTNLTFLDLQQNQICELTPLAGLTKLTELFLSYNQISNLSPLASLTKLTGLRMSNNQISDLTPLTGLTSLTDLYLMGNQISDLTPLAGLTKLTELDLQGNQISDLTPLTGLTSLTDLYLTGNQISDLTPLAGLTKLTELLLHNNKISDLMPLTRLTSLTFLILSANQISDIAPLVSNTGLATGDSVDLRDNPLSQTSINAQIPALEARGVTVQWHTTTSPFVKLTSPNGRETWQAGSSQNIMWNSTGSNYGNMTYRLYYSTNAGPPWTPITELVNQQQGDQRYVWTVPDVNSANCKVKVEAINPASITGYDQSDEVFAIRGPWSFAVITDIHIGRGYTQPYDKYQYEGNDYYLTDRLKAAVSLIKEQKPTPDFVVIVGDISNEAKVAEFVKARDTLNDLNSDGIPYITVIGNHDAEKRIDFDEVFWEDAGSQNNITLINNLFTDIRPDYQWLLSDGGKLQNYVFNHNGIKFIALDYNSGRSLLNKPSSRPRSVINDLTTTWLEDRISNNDKVILFCHHPLSNGAESTSAAVDLFILAGNLFTDKDINKLTNIFFNKDNVQLLKVFGGHVHIYDHIWLPQQAWFPARSVIYDRLFGADVITPEAYMVSSIDEEETQKEVWAPIMFVTVDSSRSLSE
jgi:internalin A